MIMERTPGLVSDMPQSVLAVDHGRKLVRAMAHPVRDVTKKNGRA
jgi:hypothetical protein